MANKTVAIAANVASVVVASLAAGSILRMHFPQIDWMPLFSKGIDLFDMAIVPVRLSLEGAARAANLSFPVPHWAPDILVPYAVNAYGFSTVSGSFPIEKELKTFKGLLLSLAWPAAIIAFAVYAFTQRAVSKFAAQHRGIFIAHHLAVWAMVSLAGFWDRLSALVSQSKIPL